MSRTYSKLTNEHQNHPKFLFQQYLYTANEPRYEMPTTLPADLEVELLEDIGPMRHEFRRLARRMRNG